MAELGKKPSLGELCVQHIIVFFVCIVFPGAATAMAPTTWLSFERNGEHVSCTTRTCAFFVVPYQVQTVANVTGIDFHADAGRTERVRKHGRSTNDTVHVDGKGSLEIRGEAGEKAEVSVSPVSIESVAEKCDSFLKTSKEGDSTTLFAIANWKFGAIMGGVLTSFTALYVVGYSLSIISFVFKSIVRIGSPATTS